MRRALLSFYHSTPHQILEVTYAWPGFGWVADYGEHVMVDDNWTDSSISLAINDYEEVLVSVSTQQHLELVERMFRGDDRILCGGPWAKHWKGKKYLGPIESLLNTNYESAEYCTDWIDRLPNGLKFGAGISAGTGCVWSRCTFCSSHGKLLKRHNWKDAVEAVLDTGKINEIHACVPGPDLQQVEIFVSALPLIRGNSAILAIFVREPELRSVIRSDMDLTGLEIEVGLEALSDPGLAPLHKGISIQQTLETVQRTLQLGASVHIMVMPEQPKEDQDQANYTLNVIEKLVSEHPGRCSLNCGDPTVWPNKTCAIMAGGTPRRDKYNRGWISVGQEHEDLWTRARSISSGKRLNRKERHMLLCTKRINEIMTCPFCSGTDFYHVLGGKHFKSTVQCNSCRSTGPLDYYDEYQSENTAVENWKNIQTSRHRKKITIEETSYTLRCCPWCGEYELIFRDGRVCCDAMFCAAEGPIAKTKQEAIELWNKHNG